MRAKIWKQGWGREIECYRQVRDRKRRKKQRREQVPKVDEESW